MDLCLPSLQYATRGRCGQQRKYITPSCTTVSIHSPPASVLQLNLHIALCACSFSVCSRLPSSSPLLTTRPPSSTWATRNTKAHLTPAPTFHTSSEYVTPNHPPVSTECSLLISPVLTVVLGHEMIFAGAHRRHLPPRPACSKRLSNPTNATSPTMESRARILTGPPQVSRRGPYLRTKTVCFSSGQPSLRPLSTG